MLLVRVVPTSTPRISLGLQEEYDLNSKAHCLDDKLQVRGADKISQASRQVKVFWKGCAREIPIFPTSLKSLVSSFQDACVR